MPLHVFDCDLNCEMTCVVLQCVGVPHLREGDVPPQGGKPGWAAPPDPRMGPWLRLLKKIAQSHNLVPEFEVLNVSYSFPSLVLSGFHSIS